jgi:hypothetical protein
MAKKKVPNTRPYQVMLKPKDHELLKKRAQQLKLTIGEFLGNLLGSLECRIDKYKGKGGLDIDPKVQNDEIDIRLIKLIMAIDRDFLIEGDIQFKLGLIKEKFHLADYKPAITIEEDD